MFLVALLFRVILEPKPALKNHHHHINLRVFSVICLIIITIIAG